MRTVRAIRHAAVLVASLALVLIVAPAAHAAPTWTTSSLTSAGPYVSGDTATYTLDIINTGDAAGGTGGVIELRENGVDVTVVGTPTVADGPGAGADRSGQVAVAAGSNEITIGAAFAAGDARVTIVVRLPRRFESSWNVLATGMPGVAFSEADVNRVVAKGSGSLLELDVVTTYPTFATKDSPYTYRLRATNKGAGVAVFPSVELSYVSGAANSLSPVPPAFTPTNTFVSGCIEPPSPDGCLLPDLAPGQSVEVEVRIDALTHYGDMSASHVVRSAESNDGGYSYHYFQVTNGTRGETAMWLDGPSTGAGNADLTYTGGIVVQSGSALGSSILRLETDGFDATGRAATTAATELPSFKSITLTNGAVCAKRVVAMVEQPNEWECPFASLAVGQVLGYTVVLNHPTALTNIENYLEADLDSVTGLLGDDAYVSTKLNAVRTATGLATVSAPPLAGSDRVVTATVTFTNTGNVRIHNVRTQVKLPSADGAFIIEPAVNGCATDDGDRLLVCSFSGMIEPGASTSWSVRVRMPARTGAFVIGVSAYGWDAATSDAYFGPSDYQLERAAVVQLVKPSLAPFVGASGAKLPARNALQLATAGITSRYVCPRACRANVQLRVSRAVAQRLGLVRRTRNTKGFVVLGTGVKSLATSGNAVVVARPAMQYRAKLRTLRLRLPLQVVSTVVSTGGDDKDARWTATRTISVTPAPRRTRR